MSRSELFDEADLDAALARFDELNHAVPQLENAASQVMERFHACFVARDWDAVREILAEDSSIDDRRPMVNAGLLRGRDAALELIRATADREMTTVTSTVVATRGARLALIRASLSGDDQGPAAFRTDLLGIVEIDADNRLVAQVVLDPEDIDAAFEEFDARYVAGEAAAHAHTWSVVTRAHAVINRRELPATTPDCVNIDHRHVTPMAPGDLIDNIRASWDVVPDICTRVEAVHRLSDLGAVVTWVANGTSQEGFEAAWRSINVVTVDGELLSRVEVFDEADLDAALATFDELCAAVSAEPKPTA